MTDAYVLLSHPYGAFGPQAFGPGGVVRLQATGYNAEFNWQTLGISAVGAAQQQPLAEAVCAAGEPETSPCQLQFLVHAENTVYTPQSAVRDPNDIISAARGHLYNELTFPVEKLANEEGSLLRGEAQVTLCAQPDYFTLSFTLTPAAELRICVLSARFTVEGVARTEQLLSGMILHMQNGSQLAVTLPEGELEYFEGCLVARQPCPFTPAGQPARITLRCMPNFTPGPAHRIFNAAPLPFCAEARSLTRTRQYPSEFHKEKLYYSIALPGETSWKLRLENPYREPLRMPVLLELQAQKGAVCLELKENGQPLPLSPQLFSDNGLLFAFLLAELEPGQIIEWEAAFASGACHVSAGGLVQCRLYGATALADNNGYGCQGLLPQLPLLDAGPDNRPWPYGAGGLELFSGELEEGPLVFNRRQSATVALGPHLAKTVLGGVSAGGELAFRAVLSTPASQDCYRLLIDLELWALRPVKVRQIHAAELAGPQSDGMPVRYYNFGSTENPGEAQNAPRGGKGYLLPPFAATGTAPYGTLFGAYMPAGALCAPAQRVLILRGISGRAAGVAAAGRFALLATQNRFPGAALALVLPAGQWLPGDAITAQLEAIALPQLAADYFGTSEEFYRALKRQGDSPRMALREAAGNHLRVSCLEGALVGNRPLTVRAENGKARFTAEGGLGRQPVCVEGLEPGSYVLDREQSGSFVRHRSEDAQAERDALGRLRLVFLVDFTDATEGRGERYFSFSKNT